MAVSSARRQNDPMSAQRELHLREFFPYILGACLVILTFVIRAWWYPFPTSDYTYFVKPWFDALATHPALTAFAQPFSDYSPAYLYLLKLLTFLPRSIDTIMLVKLLSFVFDVIIAAFAVLFARDTSPIPYRASELLLIFSIFVSIPTMMLNSSLWGQSDAIYAAPILACLYCMLKDRPFLASVAFGVALSVKLQAIFFVPVLIGYLLRSKATSMYLFLPPLIYVLSILPTAFVGGEFPYWLMVYLKESGEYPYLSVSAPSIYAFINDVPISAAAQTVIFWIGIVSACIWSVAVARWVQRMRTVSATALVLTSLACVLIVPYLLPRMHERYFYLADIFSCLYALYAPRRWYLPVVAVAASTLAYMPYLSSQIPFLASVHVDLRVPAALLFAAIVLVLVDMLGDRRPSGIRSSEPDAKRGYFESKGRIASISS